jgi:hypothetical protein
MGIKYLLEADAWQKDKQRFTSGEWSRDELLAVSGPDDRFFFFPK